jgi:hypothetical protein
LLWRRGLLATLLRSRGLLLLLGLFFINREHYVTTK